MVLVFELMCGAWKKGFAALVGLGRFGLFSVFFPSFICVLDAAGEPFLVFSGFEDLALRVWGSNLSRFFLSLCFAFFSTGLVCAAVWWFSFTLAISA